MFEEKIVADEERAERPAARPALAAPPRAMSPAAILALQRGAGNRAVAAMLSRTPEPATEEPMGESPVDEPVGECVEGELSVDEAGANLQELAQTYADAVPMMKRSSEATWSIERDWGAKRNTWAGLIEVLGSHDVPDPERWEAIVMRWDVAAEQLAATLAVPIGDDTINECGLQCQQALELFEDTFVRAHDARETFAAYMEAFSDTAETTAFVAGLARDIAFCAAVAGAVVMTAPVVAGAAAAVGTGTLGLAAGSTALAAFELGTTVTAMGLIGAGIEGRLNVLGTLGVQAGDALTDLLQGSADAADNFDLEELRDAKWEGMKRGFVDGVLAFAGLQAERVLAVHAGDVIHAVLGPGSGNLYGLVLRRTLMRASAGGIAGGPIGALDAGCRAALEGQDLDGITEAMALGFGVGLGVGTAAGAVGGAYEVYAAETMRRRIAAGFRAEVLNPSADAAEVGAEYQQLLGELNANPTAGSNAQLIELTPRVWAAMNDPDALATPAAELLLEEHLLGLMVPAAIKDRWGEEAAMALARRRGAPVRVLQYEQEFMGDEFFDEVVTSGERWLDLSVLKTDPDHGSITHLLQDQVVDRALAGTGVTAEQYRALLANATGDKNRAIGESLWLAVFDPYVRRVNAPEVIWGVMRKELEGLR